MANEQSTPRCLVGTLYSGEGEAAACEQALQSQHFCNWQHFWISDLPEDEAHRKLYSTFEARRSEFDYFVKLDADMIFLNDRILGDMIQFMADRASLDHVRFSVNDYLSNERILGLHIFSPNARWREPAHPLHADQAPKYPGEGLDVWSNPAPVAWHATDPTDYQAFHFGAHRTLKALNAPTERMRYGQWHTMFQVLKHAKINEDRRLRLVLLGGLHVWRGHLVDSAQHFRDDFKERLYENYVGKETSELWKMIPQDWLNELASSGKPKVGAMKRTRRRIKRWRKESRAKKRLSDGNI